MKMIYKDKEASVHWSAARNKERFHLGDKLRLNRGSNAGFVSPSVLNTN